MNPAIAELNRAYIHGRVIEANLERLQLALAVDNTELSDALRPIVLTFGQYVRSLRDASAVAGEGAQARAR